MVPGSIWHIRSGQADLLLLRAPKRHFEIHGPLSTVWCCIGSTSSTCDMAKELHMEMLEKPTRVPEDDIWRLVYVRDRRLCWVITDTVVDGLPWPKSAILVLYCEWHPNIPEASVITDTMRDVRRVGAVACSPACHCHRASKKLVCHRLLRTGTAWFRPWSVLTLLRWTVDDPFGTWADVVTGCVCAREWPVASIAVVSLFLRFLQRLFELCSLRRNCLRLDHSSDRPW